MNLNEFAPSLIIEHRDENVCRVLLHRIFVSLKSQEEHGRNQEKDFTFLGFAILQFGTYAYMPQDVTAMPVEILFYMTQNNILHFAVCNTVIFGPVI